MTLILSLFDCLVILNLREDNLCQLVFLQKDSIQFLIFLRETMAKSDLLHVQVEGNVFEGKADELAKLLEEGGKTVDAQGNAD